MTSENERPATNQGQRVEADIVETRSTSGTIIAGVVATGVLAGGLGQFAGGVAKLKDSLSGGGEKPVSPADAPKAARE